MFQRIVESAIQNFSLTDLLVFSTLFVFLYNIFILMKKAKQQKSDINKLENTEEEPNQRFSQGEPSETSDTSVIKVLVTVTSSFYNYGLLSLGKNSKITEHLQPGSSITVKCGKNKYYGKVHSSVAGRIDGLTKMYKENPELKKNERMEITYKSEKKQNYCDVILWVNLLKKKTY